MMVCRREPSRFCPCGIPFFSACGAAADRGRESSVQLINSLGEDKTIVVVAQREARIDSPQPTDLYSIGTLAVVHKVVKMPNQSLFVFAEGLERVRLDEYTQLTPFMRATVEHRARSAAPKDAEVEALQRNILTLFQQIVSWSPTFRTNSRRWR